MRTCLVVLALAASPRLAPAQEWCTSRAPTSGSYRDCALQIEGDQLIRGTGDVVASAGPYSGLPLHRFVRGDSAAFHAVRYEQVAFGTGAFRFVGDAALFVGSIITLTHSSTQTHVRHNGAVLMVSGLSIHALSIPLRWQADKEAEWAIAWNNKALREEH